MFDYYIYNAARERAGILQHAVSVQWLEKYQSPGEVKIVAQATPENINLLVEGNRIYSTGSDTCALICQVDMERVEMDRTLTVRGKLTAELLSRRVVMATERIVNVEAGIYALYSRNRRELPIGTAAMEGYGEAVQTEITWGTVLEAAEDLCEQSGLGFKVLFNPQSGAETLKVYKGVDRTDDTGAGYVGYFGTDIGNVQKALVSRGTANYKNVAVVAGAGEGTERVVRIVSLGRVSGEERRELYVDARDLQPKYQVAKPTGNHDEDGNPTYEYEDRNYTDEEYNAILDDRGRKKLAEYLMNHTLDCDVTQANILYGRDYRLGDRMPIKLAEAGIYGCARIAGVNMVSERAGERTVVELDEFTIKEDKK